MMTYNAVSADKVKKHAEVFTPAGVVFKMLMSDEIIPTLKNVCKPIFDPATGEGQFPCAELVLKMFYNLDKLDETTALKALGSLYAMDNQSVNIDKARAHLLATIFDAYEFFTDKSFDNLGGAVNIILQNTKCGDSLKFMQSLDKSKEPTFYQQSLF